MTALAPPPELGASDDPDRPGTAGGKQVDRAFRAIALAAGLLVLAILALIAYITTKQGVARVRAPGPRASSRARNWDPNDEQLRRARRSSTARSLTVGHRARARGARSASASRCSSPSSRRSGCARPVMYVVDLLAAIPSVVYGFWALAVLDHARPRHVYTAHRRHDRQGSRCSAASSAARRAARAS